ncbi:clostripain-related cysteine peptidase [Herpetosiphon gulosus]
MDGSVLWNRSYNFDVRFGDCSYWYRAIIGTGPGNQFKFYSALLDQVPSDPINYEPFLDRARLDVCTVTSNSTVNCVKQTQTTPYTAIDFPAEDQLVSGVFQINGWAADASAPDSPGVDLVNVSIEPQGGQVSGLGDATFGLQRTDVATFYGDTRFTNSGFVLSIDTMAFPDGPATLRVNAHSTVTDSWLVTQRRIVINNGPPPNLTRISPNEMVTNATDIPFVFTGANFRAPAEVFINGLPLENVEVQSSTTIHGVLNSTLLPGQYDATVKVGGRVSILPGAVRVLPRIDETQFRAMVYMACDSPDLPTSCDRLFNQLELAMVNDPNLRIVVLWDGASDGDSAYYLIKRDSDLRRRALYQEGVDVFHKGELDTGYGNTLVEFMGWAQARYPGKYKFLSFAGHGGGWAPDTHPGQPRYITGQPSTNIGGMLWDGNPGNTMSTTDLAQSLRRIANGYTIDDIYLDACLMGGIETVAEIASTSQFVIAHESWTWTYFPYAAYFAGINTATNPETLARQIATANRASWQSVDYPSQISVIKSSEVPILLGALNQLANELRKALPEHRSTLASIAELTMRVDENADGIISSQGDDYIDLGEFASRLAATPNLPAGVIETASAITQPLSNAVLINYTLEGVPYPFPDTQPWPLQRLKGLSIYFPLNDEWKRGFYTSATLPVFGQTTWDDFIQDWFTQAAPEPPTEPCDHCPPLPAHASLWMEAATPAIVGEILPVEIKLNGLLNEDDLRGLQVVVRSNNPAAIKPSTTNSPRDPYLFPRHSLTEFTRTADSWSAIFSLSARETNPVVGGGTVISFPFLVGTQGCTELTFTVHVFSNGDGGAIPHTWRNLEVCAGERSLDGMIYLQSRTPGKYAGAEIVLRHGSDRYVAVSDAQGRYHFGSIKLGKYKLTVTHPLFLYAERTVTISAPESTMPDIGLWGGDMNGDGKIHKNDWYICSAASIPVSDPAFDINADGVTDVRDCVILANNINQPHLSKINPPRPFVATGARLEKLQTLPTINSTEYVHLEPQANGQVLLKILQPAKIKTGLALRLNLPTGVTMTSVVANSAITPEYLNWHQDGATLYLLVLPTTIREGAGLKLDFSQANPSIGIESLNIGRELGPPMVTYLPLITQ